MAAARTVAITDFYQNILYELRDPEGNIYNKDGAYAELARYLRRCCELIHDILLDLESEIILTGTGTIATVDGTQSYDLSANTMGDLVLPEKIWITNYERMEVCERWEIDDAIQQEEISDSSRGVPERYCIIGDYIWFETVPDDAYTVNFRYFPNYTDPATSMPYKNIFNNDITEGVLLFAKRRNERDMGVEAILKDMFLRRASKIIRRRERKVRRFIPVV